MMVKQGVNKGLARVERIYQDRAARAKELKGQGKKIMGYLCCQASPELMTAAGLVPFRIIGNAEEPITRADECVETILCPFVRSSFDIALKGIYDFLDGFICPHTCDNVTNVYEIWQYYLHPPYSHFVNVPHTQSQPSIRFLEAELGTFKRSLEGLTGADISSEQMEAAITLHNQNRALVRELYEFRKPDPPLLSGTEMMKTIVAVMSLPVEEANMLLREVIREVKERPSTLTKAPRILLYGAIIDNAAFTQVIEDNGANIVMDDLCLGSRTFWHDVETGGNPLASLAAYYLTEITCPRTYKLVPGGWEEELEERFGYLRNMAEEYRVDGVIFFDMRYCDIFGFQAPDVRDYLGKAGFPLLYIENDYAIGSIARIKTRVEAFLEMIAGSRR